MMRRMCTQVRSFLSFDPQNGSRDAGALDEMMGADKGAISANTRGKPVDPNSDYFPYADKEVCFPEAKYLLPHACTEEIHRC